MKNNKKFTLIELLVVIAIIGILAAMVMPALAKSRAKAKQTQGRNLLKQVGINIMAYMSDQASAVAPNLPAVGADDGDTHSDDIPTLDPFFLTSPANPGTDASAQANYGYENDSTNNAGVIQFAPGSAISASDLLVPIAVAAGQANAIKYAPSTLYVLKADMSVADGEEAGYAAGDVNDGQ